MQKCPILTNASLSSLTRKKSIESIAIFTLFKTQCIEDVPNYRRKIVHCAVYERELSLIYRNE